MERKQIELIIKDLKKKMVFIVGPRQVGKTWLAREIMKRFLNPVYLNYDSIDHREIIKTSSWPRTTDLLVLDELHKMPEWKNFLKGIFDTKPENLSILVTGSARLNAFRQGGDSLAGRFYTHRLLPFSMAELKENGSSFAIEHYLSRGGFPEPFLAESGIEADRWRSQYVDGLIRNDILDLGIIESLRNMQTVFELLRRRVGSQVSFASLARDLAVSPTTIAKYVSILEALFIVFRITPFSRNIARSLLKEPKIYFFDNGLVAGDEGAKFENFMAVSLLKHVLARQDQLGESIDLHYLKTKDGRETDFCLTGSSGITLAIEAKNQDSNLSANLKYFCEKYGFPGRQAVCDLSSERSLGNIDIISADRFLSGLYL